MPPAYRVIQHHIPVCDCRKQTLTFGWADEWVLADEMKKVKTPVIVFSSYDFDAKTWF
jgi:hypothetical protein